MKLTKFGKQVATCAIIVALIITGAPVVIKYNNYCYNMIFFTTILPLACLGLTYTVDFEKLFKRFG